MLPRLAACPSGSVQSLYLGRWIRAPTRRPGLAGRHTTAPARPDLMACWAAISHRRRAPAAPDQLTPAGRTAARRDRRDGAGSRCRPGPATTTRRASSIASVDEPRSSVALRRVGHPDQQLDPPVQVAVHQVGAADPAPRRPRSRRCRTRRSGSARGTGPGRCAPGSSPTGPGTPGRSPQMPRTHRSIGTPSLEARYSASMIASSMIALHLIWIRAGLARAGAAGPARSISLDQARAQRRPGRPAAAGTRSCGCTR